MKRKLHAGTTSVALPIFVQDSSSATGGGLGSLTSATSGLVAEYRRQGQSSWTAITPAAGTLGTYISGGFVADGSLAGAYEFCPPNAALASGARWVAIRLYGAANMMPVLIEIELDAVDYQDGIRAGLTALPNAAAGGTGGLPTRGGAIPDATAGASGGLPILGSNAAAVSFTAGMTISNASGDALTLTSSGSNGSGLNAAGNGSGHGIKATAGASGNGLHALGGSGSGYGVYAAAQAGNYDGIIAMGHGNGAGIEADGGASGSGIIAIGGISGGNGIYGWAQAGSGGYGLAAAGGIWAAGTAASGSTPATAGLTVTGGAASTTSGGTSAAGVSITGGAGAASTNGAAAGWTVVAGGTTTVSGNDAAVFTGTGNGSGVTMAHAGTGKDLNATTTSALAVNATAINSVSTSSVTTIGANVGTTQPINFSGTGSSAYVKSDAEQFGGHAVVLDANNYPGVNLVDVAGNAASTYTGQAQAGTSTSITLAAGEANNPLRCEIAIVGNTGAGQKAICTAWNSSTKVATTYCPQGTAGAWVTNPDSSSLYAINDLLPGIDSAGNVAVAGPFKLNTAAGFEFAMVQSSDHVSGYTSPVSLAATREINGAGTTTAGGTVTQVGTTNRYYFSGTAADFNGANVTFTFTATGADPVTVSINTTP